MAGFRKPVFLKAQPTRLIGFVWFWALLEFSDLNEQLESLLVNLAHSCAFI